MWLPIPGPPNDSVKAATARQNIWHGPVRSGKTVSSLIAWILFVDEAPLGGELFMIGKTQDALESNALVPLQAFLGNNFRYSLHNRKAAMRRASTGTWREIRLVTANDERAEAKVRGSTAAGAYGDEITLWPESLYRQLLARMSLRGSRLFGTTNPDGPYHWLKAGFLDRSDELDLHAFTWPIDVNTHLAPEYIDQLKAEYEEGSLWYRRFIEGQWVAAEGAVYDFFDEARHTIDVLPNRQPDQVDVSIDYGTSNATSAGAYASWNRIPKGELRAVRLGGYYYDGRATGRQKTDREYAEEIGAWIDSLGYQVRHVFLDPSAASFGTELSRHGMWVKNANNDVLDGIRTQAKLLRAGEYKIARDPSNGQCIRDYGAYLWDTKAQARGEDKPLKQHDHTKDEERYYLHTMFGAPELAGGLITTRGGQA